MNQQLLKNIYDAFGEMTFVYRGRIMFVAKDEATGQYELKAGGKP
jgi:predicted small secreted protein